MRVLKESFNAGEFTPRLHSRYELAKYKNGCKTLTNFIPLPHGPVTRRPGTEYLGAVKTASAYTRLIPFSYSESISYVLEFGPAYIRFWKNGGRIQTVDANTVLLLHFDGINNSTTIDDSGATDHTMTAVNNAKLKTAQKKFGSASCYFDGATDSITADDHANWNFGSSEFTIDFWVRFKSFPDYTVGLNCYIFNQWVDSTHYQYLDIIPADANTLQLRYRFNNAFGGGAESITRDWDSPALNTWYHVALVRGWGSDSDEFAFTVDGVLLDSSETITETVPDLAAGIEIGSMTALSSDDFNGYLDEFRISTAARWTAAFTPPTSQYPFGDDSGADYEIVSTYTEVDIPDLYFVQSADTMYIVHENYVVRSLTRTADASWAIANVSFTNAPLAWSAGDYPRTIEFYEDRLCFGGSPDQPDTIWTTDSSDYTYFDAQATLEGITVAFVEGGGAADTITDSGNGFVTAGFVASMPITVSGSTSNDGTYTIATVAAGTITLIAADDLADEAAGKNVTLTGGAAADDDAITLTLLARRINDIQWMSAGRRLIVGTGGEEWWVAGPSDTEPITPSDHIARSDSAWGSKRVMPVNIGGAIFYVQQSGKKVMELIYQYSEDKYVSTDMNVLSEHLTKTYGITAMAFQQDPYGILWCLRSDGSVLSLSYLKEHDVVAWAEHTFGGDGVVESLTTIPGLVEDEVWFVVKRTVNGSVVRYIERLKPFNFGSSLEDAFFVDCGLTYDSTAATAISGLSHLEAEAVAVLADGAVVTGHTVASGAITLATAASKIHIGILSTPELETLDVVSEDNEGPLQGVIKRITNISISLINSMGGLFGPDSSTTDSIHYRDETTLFTGWTKDMEFDEQDDVTSTVYITSDEPLPLEIAAISIDLEDN